MGHGAEPRRGGKKKKRKKKKKVKRGIIEKLEFPLCQM
jgi:hypothetical protein